MKRMKLVAASVTCLLVLGVYASRTQAYATFAKWGSNSVVFYVNPANADVDPGVAEAAVQAGMTAWNTEGSSAFKYLYGGRVNDTSTGYDSRNVVVFRNATSGSALATTYSWWSGTTLVDSDIIFWDAAYTFVAGADGCSGAAYIEDVATHELGHALGLNHSGDTAATMYPSYSWCSQEMRTLGADDVAGIQSLYGRSTTSSNTAPTVTISSPTTTTVAQGAAISFAGAASDKEDGNITSRLVWTSTLSGQIGVGGAFTVTLPAGTHLITASATDNNGLAASKQVSVTVTAPANTAPSVTISSPSSTSLTAGASIAFAGSANDTQDGSLTAALVWTSNLVGQIGLGGSFTTTLPAGSHTITASVSDSGGLVGSKQMLVSVSVANTAPSVSILSPSSATFASGSAITFMASANDGQDGALTSRIVWKSSMVGQFGTGGNFAMTLPSGVHVITASVSDNGGMTSSQQVTVTVSAPVAPTVVSDRTLSASGYKIKAGMQRADLSWTGFSTASVDVLRNGSQISTVTNSGAWTDPINNKGGGSYRYKVCESGTTNCSNEVTVTF
jgi:hypothetical protein